MKFAKTGFCRGVAYEVAGEKERDFIRSIVPVGYIHRVPAETEASVCGLFAELGYVITRHPGGERVLLVLTMIDNKKMAFVLKGDNVVLVTITLSDKEYFTKNTVFEGYLTPDGTLHITDLFVLYGTDMGEAEYQIRYFGRCVALRCHYKYHQGGVIRLKFVEDSRTEDFQELIKNGFRVIVQSGKESIRSQMKTSSMYITDSNVDF